MLAYLERAEIFFLVLVRLTTFFMVAPIFSARSIPVLVRVGLAVLLAFLLFPILSTTELALTSEITYALAALREALVGLALGYLAALLLATVQVGGELLDIHMGLSMANLLDPQYGMPVTLWGQFFTLLGLLLFLQFDGHHIILLALQESFMFLPLGSAKFSGVLVQDAVRIWGDVMRWSLNLALPVIGALLIADVALSLLARTVPQLNVFILSFPIKLGLGLLVVILILPFFAAAISNLVGQMERDLGVILSHWRY
ncbi:flagellar biosynthetic protein FliR [Thermanaeromonas toyohensis ToBE]|uniref:Flagellar biosynthetic protein FliR n=1 Tax=Thermanaeromonas toyohensis ToBE TaxID=698762 RepID=A0A1W1VL53_9FIRM|nr:flagellar biosynthetic protein FliR [Thermanaeromonas toyohensis]SMB94058.1 flagellar biosynthetic protein FliR [Thermanaeromonas toyohensis ToBE]